MRLLLGVLILGITAVPTWATGIVVDGTRDALYGGAKAVQTVQTGFGDASPDGGSELDAGYARCCDDGKLYIMLTGNIEANFNKLEIFIDSYAGGQAVFDSSGNDGAAAMDGLVFDSGFTADYHLIVRRGNDGGNDKFDLDFADLAAQTASSYQDFLIGGGSTGIGTTGVGVNLMPIMAAYDNSNTAGVTGGSGAADQNAAMAVTTGLELGIALSDLNWDGRAINIMAGQNNQGHNYWSNQFLAGLPAPQGNLGGDEAGGFTGEGAIDMTHFGGNQYFTACPEPSTAALVTLAVVGMLGFARRRK
ncbi:MAG: PEP-CTERM sorting domain-containing protein [Pirellulales bacterium]